MNIKVAWDKLHGQKRFCPIYPNDRVVAWTFRNFSKESAFQYNLLDLGCGAGRHALFWAAEGYSVSACDFSSVGIEETNIRAQEKDLSVSAYQCEADELLFADNEFDGILCYGVLYYLPYKRYLKAVKEIHRVLKPGGKALVITRTKEDSRTLNAKKVDACTYRLNEIVEGAPSEVEAGMVMTFLDLSDVETIYQVFSAIIIDRCTVTSNNGKFVDDDWLVQVVK
jgi:ubiquinone/menaquinone biosynthesis C-methylase UbiE